MLVHLRLPKRLPNGGMINVLEQEHFSKQIQEQEDCYSTGHIDILFLRYLFQNSNPIYLEMGDLEQPVSTYFKQGHDN